MNIKTLALITNDFNAIPDGNMYYFETGDIVDDGSIINVDGWRVNKKFTKLILEFTEWDLYYDPYENVFHSKRAGSDNFGRVHFGINMALITVCKKYAPKILA